MNYTLTFELYNIIQDAYFDPGSCFIKLKDQGQRSFLVKVKVNIRQKFFVLVDGLLVYCITYARDPILYNELLGINRTN